MSEIFHDFEDMLKDSEPFEEMNFPQIEGKLPGKKQIDPKQWEDLYVHIEVVFGTTSLSFSKLSNINKEVIIPLEQQENELCDVWVNGQKFAKGKIVSQNGCYGLQIHSILDDPIYTQTT